VSISKEALDALRQVSTATLTTQLFKRGLRNAFVQGVRPVNPSVGTMAGPAVTLRYIPAREDIDTLDVFKNPDHPQRKTIEEIPAGAVLVMDCRGDTSAASAGGILVTRMQVRGAAGLVTDGGLRDCPEIVRMALPVFCGAPSAPLNLVRHHAVDANRPIACGGVPVYPGDVVVGDGEGVVVVPAHLAEEVARDALPQEEYERFAIAQVRQGRALTGLYPPSDATLAEYEAWRRNVR
jgi:regulator of RNase E activity RraA